MTRRRAFNLLLEFSIPLIAGVLAALAWANLAPHSYHQLVHGSPFGEGSHLNLHFAVNDVFMALFFGIAAKEITESALPGGALNPPRKAINPLLGTLGGVLGPITSTSSTWPSPAIRRSRTAGGSPPRPTSPSPGSSPASPSARVTLR